jgi:hypothetical protein
MRPVYWGLALSILMGSLGILLLVMYSQNFFEIMCPRCHGKGFTSKISRIDLNGESVIIRKDHYWRITATFHNEGDEGASEPVYAYVEYEGEKFDEKTISWYFPPSAYTTVTLNLHASTAYKTETYDMNVPSENRVVICPQCQGKAYVPNWDAVKLFAIASLVVVNILLLLPFPKIRLRKSIGLRYVG